MANRTRVYFCTSWAILNTGSSWRTSFFYFNSPYSCRALNHNNDYPCAIYAQCCEPNIQWSLAFAFLHRGTIFVEQLALLYIFIGSRGTANLCSPREFYYEYYCYMRTASKNEAWGLLNCILGNVVKAWLSNCRDRKEQMKSTKAEAKMCILHILGNVTSCAALRKSQDVENCRSHILWKSHKSQVSSRSITTLSHSLRLICHR